MGKYLKGDVLLASVSLDDRTGPKIRPVVVIEAEETGWIRICPVSSRPPCDMPGLPLTLEDFMSGGLDLFCESYVITSRVLTLHSGDVFGKKGRLTAEALAEIAGRVPASMAAVPAMVKKPGRSSKGL